MATTQTPTRFTREIALFLATGPSPDQMLSFHPSEQVRQRARELLEKQRQNRLTADEEWELNQFEHAEMLLQLVKATIRAEKVRRP
jgi:hypothetical protein